ncbi:TauD/TfdA family dioxygenase [Streptomyces alfalfae]|uniref:Pentalenolactone F synthase n=1 Tax=Streptomyces alfalfae TaxID=1642299 RepID=A0A1P8TE29_9ACTN|nr:TauD/TfdA family dioxygenase [Streptomyces alfalfae]AYA16239.1 TauD/TfdA family dioxygenase [Streptomyces fradiae]APY85877.1 taurine catabolism dioxygenase [Streptomyces alfalfae]QQC91872.1 TauD/TfdA family dioxygenase [Streptomyces alfalfae]QUI34388.1 TauD/TfdA family dioxygenase [Streptomyces alfalfae]RXX38224.1 TauD/TfdA family dioxygenase [Streptomyces alfalfae]
MDVTPIPGAALGAVVDGAHVSGDMDEAQANEIWAALDAHLVLVFRGHETPTYEEFLAFGRRFGHIPKTGLTSGAHPDHNEILIVSNLVEDGRKIGVGDAGWMGWHTDYSFRPRVSQVGFLEAVEVPPSGGGETLFTDMYALYESLPAEERRRLHSYRVRHALRTGYEETIEEELQGEVSLGEDPRRIRAEDGTSTVHPLVARNPRTGRRSVYVSTLNTERIVDLAPDAGRELLDKLLAHAGTPRHTYAHTWRPGDIVMWDQLGTVHAKRAFDPAERRVMRQVVSIFDDPTAPWRAEAAA